MKNKGKNTNAVDAALAKCDLVEAAFGDRILLLDTEVMREAARMLGEKNKNERDTMLAATASVQDLAIVTRNVKDFVGRSVRVLNPFDNTPKVVTV